jgi:hypothetical protein
MSLSSPYEELLAAREHLPIVPDVCIDCDWPIRWNERATETETGWIHDSCQKLKEVE